MRLFTVEVRDRTLRVFLNTAALNLDQAQLLELSYSIRDLAARVQARVVRNVSGYPVMYDGQVFRVVVRTGALKGAIDMEWPYQGAFQARVYVNGSHTAEPFQLGDMLVKPRPVGDYASAIEFGHGPIDLKQYMMGKTVPFFASRTTGSTGPFAARGLTPVDGMPGSWENRELNAKLAHPLWHGGQKPPMYFQQRKASSGYAKGGAGTYYIAFRKVGKTGWVIPAARARPFMRAAATGPAAQRDARELTRERLRGLLSASTGH